MEIGISTLVDVSTPFDELARMIADAGFTHLSLSHDVEHSGYHLPPRRQSLSALLELLGLKLDYIHAPITYYFDITSLDPRVRRLSVEALKFCLAACAELGGQGVVAHAMNGPLGAGESVEQRVQAGLGSVAELLEDAQRLGVALYAENLPLSLDCGMVSLAFLRAASALPALSFCLDSCHARMGNEGWLTLVRELAPRVGATHLSDTLGVEDSHLIPLTGAVDFRALAEELGRAGFGGVIDLECSLWMLKQRHQKGKPQPGDPPSAEVERWTTPGYLRQAYSAAAQIDGWMQEARTAK